MKCKQIVYLVGGMRRGLNSIEEGDVFKLQKLGEKIHASFNSPLKTTEYIENSSDIYSSNKPFNSLGI